MRWSELAAKLPAAAYSDLVNHLTAGRGHLYIAARLITANAAAARVLAQLAQARRALAAVHDGLATATGAAAATIPPVPLVPDPVGLPALPWQAFLASKPAGMATEVATAVATVRTATQQVATGLQTDAAVALLQEHLATGVASLDRLQQLCDSDC